MDIIISNCVVNLVPEKSAAFAEMMRVLKPGGRISVSDVVLKAEAPEVLRRDVELYAGCVSGAIPKADYLDMLRTTGFATVAVDRERAIALPEEILERHLSKGQAEAFKTGNGALSITVTAVKPW